MIGREQIEGEYYNIIQCPEISSSTDKETQYPIHSTYPRGRNTYRQNPNLPLTMAIPIRQIPMRINNVNAPAPAPTKGSTGFSLLCLGILFFSSLILLHSIYSSFPEVTQEERVHIKIPWNFEDAKKLGFVLDKYKDDHYYKVLVGVCMTYIFLQTFAIPGSLFLSVLSGFLFSFFEALALVCTCSAIGASLCFSVSQLVGRKLVRKYFPERARSWAVIVHKHRDNLLNYVIFLRVTPFVPNWFINLTAPVIGVPLAPFFFGTLIGVAPPSFIALQTGKTLHSMSASDSALSWQSVGLLIVFGVLSLIPIYFKEKLKKKFE